MRRRMFIKNLLFALLTTCLPLMILSFAALGIFTRFLRNESEINNYNLLTQIKKDIESTFYTIASIGIKFNTDSDLLIDLKNVLKSDTIPFENYYRYKEIMDFLHDSEFIHPSVTSIYLYAHDNRERFLSSNIGIAHVHSNYDVMWINDWEKGDKQYSLRKAATSYTNKTPTEYLTLFSNFYYPGSSAVNGVLAVNVQTSYIRSILNSITVSPSEAIVLTSSDNRIIAYSDNYIQLMKEDRLLNDNFFDKNNIDSNFIASSINSDFLDWNYITIIPKSSLYKLPIQFIRIILVIFVVSLVIGFLLALYFTSKLCSSVNYILDALSATYDDRSEIAAANFNGNEYEFIIRNIMRIFLQKNKLDSQLAEKHYKLQIMELIALQSQINPHFLYNTLQVIYFKAMGITKGPNQVNSMIEHLMVVLRYSFKDPVNTVALSEEIRCAESYLMLQQFQYGSKLFYDIKTQVDSNKVFIPKLILQPLIENAIMHGMRPDDSTLRIRIRTYYRDGAVIIKVIDNGNGTPSERKKNITDRLELIIRGSEEDDELDSEKSPQIGLFHTAKRISLFYSARAVIRYISVYNVGTCIKLQMPEKIK